MPVGGNHKKCHIDTFVPSYMASEFGISTLLDIGCSTGDMVRVFQSLGIDAEGIDGDKELVYRNNIKYHDLTFSPYPGKWDAIWSVEVLEHLEKGFALNNFFETIKYSKIVFCTASQDNSPSVHVTIEPLYWWENEFKKYGFILDCERTSLIRKNSDMERDFIRNTGMIYIRS